jgi:hypothetical protein
MSSQQQGRNKDFDIISAIATRDAAVEDIVRELRNRGIKSVEDVLDMLRQAVVRRGDSAKAKPDPLDFRKFSVGADYKPRQDIVHTVPEIPVLIDGVMFDPKDIKRFDGQELHFIATRDRQSMIGITDRAVMGKWWEMTYVTSLTNSASSGPRALASHFSFPDPAVIYYEDDNYGGSIISHGKNRGFYDLTQHNTSLFGHSWNDRISSLQLVNLNICVLYWDIHYLGATMTFYASTTSSPEGPPSYPLDWEPSLRPYGWNDRASSVGGW